MTEHAGSSEEVARQVRIALESADLSSFAELLDPDVHWGPPGDASPPCRNREQVIAWYGRGRAAGTRASVTEVELLGDQILVGLTVTGNETARERGDGAERWQLLTVRDGRVTDIVAFEQRIEAVAWASRLSG
jgi:ketosteroid isomerase-like protein